MGRRRKQGRNVTGILLLDKPQEATSNGALQRVKWLYQAAKAGHTGSLDPLATGLLPICLGAATKFSTYLLDAHKRYRVRVLLGVSTTTADSEGEVVRTASTEGVDEANVREVLMRFLGPIPLLKIDKSQKVCKILHIMENVFLGEHDSIKKIKELFNI